MEQKMKTLEYIVNHLEDMVTMGMMNELNTQTKARSANPIAKIRAYFNEQKQTMDAAINTMGETFPIDARIKREQLLVKEELSRLVSEQTRETTRISAEYFVNMINSYSELIRQPLSTAASSFIATVLDIPAGMMETSVGKIGVTFTNIIHILMFETGPGGMIILAVLSMVFLILMGTALNTVKMVSSIFYIPMAPFVWVFQLGASSIQSLGLISEETPNQEHLAIEDSESPQPQRKLNPEEIQDILKRAQQREAIRFANKLKNLTNPSNQSKTKKPKTVTGGLGKVLPNFIFNKTRQNKNKNKNK